MGRKAKIRLEPTTSLSVYIVDSMLLDDYKVGSESKTDALRRIFIEYFGEARIKAKKRELGKKADRQAIMQSEHGDQSTIDSLDYPRKAFKDMEFSRAELIEMKIASRPHAIKDPLAKRNADDSITKAVARGDCIKTSQGKYAIVRKWF